MKKLILSIDQGTTSSRSILFDLKGKKIFSSQYEFRQIFPNLGWVEHNPEEIWKVTLKTIQEAFPIPILEKKLGNKGTKITPFGEELLKRYLDLCNHLSKESENFINWTASKQINK